MRALRPDKLTIAALAATLTEYLHGSPWDSVPVWRMLGASLDQLQSRAAHIVSACGAACLRLDIVDGRSAIGGGALPEETLPTRLVRISADGVAASELAGRLRGGEPALVGRVEHDAVILDVRTIDPSEDQEVVCALLQACEPGYAGAEPH